MKFSIKDFFRKCDQIRSFLRSIYQLVNLSLPEHFQEQYEWKWFRWFQFEFMAPILKTKIEAIEM